MKIVLPNKISFSTAHTSQLRLPFVGAYMGEFFINSNENNNMT